MGQPTFNEIVKGIGSTGLESLKTNLGKAWDSLTDKEKQQVADLLAEIAEVRVKELAGKDVSDHLSILEDALLQWKAVTSGELASALKTVAQDLAGVAGSFAVGALRGLVLKI